MYQRPPEVVALARLREDRARGAGHFDECEAYIAKAPAGDGVAAMVDRILVAGLDKAEADLREAFEAVPGLTPPAGASAWLRAVVTGEGREDDLDLDRLRDLVLVHVSLTVARGHARPATLLAFGKDGQALPARPQATPRSVEEAIGMLERAVRGEGVGACALVLCMERGGPVDAEGLLERTRAAFGRDEAPAILVACLLATSDGGRASFVAPHEDPKAWKGIPYGSEADIAQGYGFRG